LLEYHFISLVGGALPAHIDVQAAKLGAKLKTRIALLSFDGICRMANEGVGIGIVPETAARRYKRHTQIGILSLQDDWATRRLAICVRSEKELTPLALDLFQYLAA
jgi:DNA-binding transcriptional LysR family regulator